MSRPELLFLPGATGQADFWLPVTEQLVDWSCRRFGFPGFGSVVPDPAIHNLTDLGHWFIEQIHQPAVLIAQSMGGLLALQAAQAKPEYIKALVLVATSGGLNLAQYGGCDWRPAFRQLYPQLPDWFCVTTPDLSQSFQQLRLPVLLLWGLQDAISPLAVGQQLAQWIAGSRLIALPGEHDLARQHPQAVAQAVHAFLESIATDF